MQYSRRPGKNPFVGHIDYRIAFFFGKLKLIKYGLSDFRLHCDKAEFPLFVVADDPPDGTVAQIANAIEKYDMKIVGGHFHILGFTVLSGVSKAFDKIDDGQNTGQHHDNDPE